MNLEQLQERQTQIQEAFDAYVAKQKELTDEHAQIEQEKLRLQGEYRTVTGFIEELAKEQEMEQAIKNHQANYVAAKIKKGMSDYSVQELEYKENEPRKTAKKVKNIE